MVQCCGDFVHEPHVMDRCDGVLLCFIVHRCLVDEPDFNGVHQWFIFVVSNANDDCCIFIGGEIIRVVICGAIWP